MKKLALSALFAAFATIASAQQYMPLPPNTVMGNVTNQTNPGNAVTLPQLAAALASNNLVVQAASPPLVLTAGNLTCPTCVLIAGTAKGDVAYAIQPTDRYVYTSVAFTAPRIWTLPAASSVANGTTIWVQDAQSTVGSTNTLTVSRAGSDTIDFSSTTLVISGAGGGITFTSDGVSNWGTPIQTTSTGGTGQKALTNHSVLIGAGTNPITQAAAGINGQLFLGSTGADPAFGTMSQDCAITNAGVITCTKTNNVAFAPSATTDTTNAANISSSTLPAGRMPALTGDCTTSAGAVATTCLKTNGVSFTAGATAAAGQLPGTATNDNATAGNVGEYKETITPIGSAVNVPSTGNTVNVATLSLTAGDWAASCSVYTTVGGSTTLTTLEVAINGTSATLPTRGVIGSNGVGAGSNNFQNFNAAAGSNQGLVTKPTRVSLSGTTNIFCVGTPAFGASTIALYGVLNAWRVR